MNNPNKKISVDKPISKAAELREARVKEQMFGRERFAESFVTQEAKGELNERGAK